MSSFRKGAKAVKKTMRWLLACLLLASFVAGCAPAAPQTAAPPVKETVIVEKPVEKQVTVVVEKKVEQPAAAQEWEVINPLGVIKVDPIKNAPRPTTLEGKTVVLRWNGKHNGDKFLTRIAELFAEKMPSVKVVKIHEKDPSTAVISTSVARGQEIAKKIAAEKPDLVIASQAD